MNNINKITSFLDAYAPPSNQESYDNTGLITGDGEKKPEGVLIALDCTEEVVDEAINNNCNLIVSHHPVVFEGLKKITGRNYVERTIIKAIKHDIAIYAIHTNLDNIENGVNKKICDLLGLRKTKILQPKKGILKKLVTFCPVERADTVRKALFDAGGGNIGAYDSCSFNTPGTGTFRASEGTDPYVGEIGKEHHEQELKIEVIFPAYLQAKIIQNLIGAHPYEEIAYDIYHLDNEHQQVGAGMIGELENEMDTMEFLRFLKKSMKAGCVKYTHPLDKKIRKIAVCGGSGSFLLAEARRQNADVFVSADFKYHQYFDADKHIVIADIGHYESEQFTKDLLYDILKKNFPTFALRLSETKTNPVNYL
jgi:dinuclear metal center YbgI/SA1388 family protein